MIRSYLGYIEIIEMISRRLTKTQKDEILEAYSAGENTNVLADKYNCTSNTINRTVKTLLSDNEYKLLKKKRSKIIKKNDELSTNKIVKETKEDSEEENSLINLKENFNAKDLSVKVNEENQRPELKEISSLVLDDADDFCEELYSEDQKKQKL